MHVAMAGSMIAAGLPPGTPVVLDASAVALGLGVVVGGGACALAAIRLLSAARPAGHRGRSRRARSLALVGGRTTAR